VLIAIGLNAKEETHEEHAFAVLAAVILSLTTAAMAWGKPPQRLSKPPQPYTIQLLQTLMELIRDRGWGGLLRRWGGLPPSHSGGRKTQDNRRQNCKACFFMRFLLRI